jgi:hypothetical protein
MWLVDHCKTAPQPGDLTPVDPGDDFHPARPGSFFHDLIASIREHDHSSKLSAVRGATVGPSHSYPLSHISGYPLRKFDTTNRGSVSKEVK